MNGLTTSTNFKALNNAYNNGLKGLALEGASRSGKSWDTSAFIVSYINQNTGKEINVCRDHLAKLKKTTYSTLRKVWRKAGLSVSPFNKSATEIEYNGNLIRFVGINDDIMTAYGLESDLLWINEAINISEDIFKELSQRTTDFIIWDYNPKMTRHYLYDYGVRDKFNIHKTTIFDNWKYAPKNSKEQIISYAHPAEPSYNQAKKVGYTKTQWDKVITRNVKQKTANLFYWQVMGLGLRAVGESAIFPNYQYFNQAPATPDWILYGMDFGYKEDETALVKVWKAGKRIYVKELIYETGLLTDALVKKIKEVKATDSIIVCDTAPSQNVDELILRDILADGYPHKKGGSVAWGIQAVQNMELFIHKDSLNLVEELKGYEWKRDRMGQIARNSLGQRIPKDGNDHLIQAMIYASTYYLETPSVTQLTDNLNTL